MPFKLRADSLMDQPLLACDVCGEPIYDFWNAKASGDRVPDGSVTAVTVHHPACAAAGAVHIPLMDFLQLFVSRNRLGDVGSDGVLDRVSVECPMNRRFEA